MFFICSRQGRYRSDAEEEPMNIFVLTGAGVSAESGLGTFRDKDGLWARFDPMKLATPEAFARAPEQVHAFYNMRRQNLLQAEPNEAHRALARLEAGLAERGGSLFLCTQNIDDLHERAGSKQVVHMHGELLKARCTACQSITIWRDNLSAEITCPSCRAAGSLRPHVVWFGEMPLEMDTIYDALLGSDLFVAIGTSGSVYPAAGFVNEAKGHGIRTCEINLEPSDNARQFDEVHYGPASDVVPQWANDVLANTIPRTR
jgi:NAD-dependent deacetylase